MALVRGILVTFDSVTYLAVVRLDGATPQTVTGVPVNRMAAAADMVAGRKVLIDTGETGEVGDLALIATWA